MPFSIERNDLANMHVDAVVVPANEKLQITGGAGAVVAEAAGFERVQQACDEIGFCPTGSAVATPGFDLPATTIVHAVGPVWQGGDQGESDLLRQTYESALVCALDSGARSIALPLISAGTYRFPTALALNVAIDAIKSFIDSHDDVEVTLVLFNREAVMAALPAFDEVVEYIDDHYVEEHAPANFESYVAYGQVELGDLADWEDLEESVYPADLPAAPSPQEHRPAAPSPQEYRQAASAPTTSERRSPVSRIGELIEGLRARKDREEDVTSAMLEPIASSGVAPAAASSAYKPAAATDLKSWLDALDTPFSTTLLALVDARGMTDAQVYKRANMSRQLFSKIRSDVNYRPTKKTALALAIALELDLDETADLLQRAGFALSNSSKADVIVEYFIVNGNYDIFAINEALYAFDQPLL